MERIELEQICQGQSAEEKLLEFLNYHEAFEAIQDEAISFLVKSENVFDEIR